MKTLKISLAVIVGAAITIFIFRSLVFTSDPKKIALAKNPFTDRIEKEIESLSKLPDSKFCKDAHDKVKYLIDDYYKPNPPKYPYGRLAKTQSENDLWKENLAKNLYSVYAEKVISQSFFVFRGAEWNIEDLQFIRNEYQTLQKSKLLEKGRPVDKKFTEIQTIFGKYDEIVAFISLCNGFSYASSGLTDRFPIHEIQARISRAVKYQNNSLENGYVDRCKRLHDGLKEIPQTLFRAHIRYLDNKVSQWSDLHSNYTSQRDYVSNLYSPLKSEIEALDKNTYNVQNFDSEYQRLLDKWSEDNTKAYNYKY
jgi:hypothetical protein